jgi:hypothetical protein
MSDTLKRLLRRVEAAARVREIHNIPCEASSLRTLAHNGKGPPFKKVGRFPLYDPDDLDAWVLAKSSPKVRSTSELTAPRTASSIPALVGA